MSPGFGQNKFVPLDLNKQKGEERTHEDKVRRHNAMQAQALGFPSSRPLAQARKFFDPGQRVCNPEFPPPFTVLIPSRSFLPSFLSIMVMVLHGEFLVCLSPHFLTDCGALKENGYQRESHLWV